MTGHTTVTAVDLPVIIKQVDTAVLWIKDFHIRFPKRRDGSHIFPVSVKMISIHAAMILQQIRNNIISKVIFGVRVLLIFLQIFLQNIPVEDIDTHGSQIGLRILWLLLKFCDTVIFISYHQTKAGCIFPRYFHNGYTEFCIFLLVETQKIAVVLLADLVTGKDDHVLRIVALNKGNVLIDRICCTFVPV